MSLPQTLTVVMSGLSSQRSAPGLGPRTSSPARARSSKPCSSSALLESAASARALVEATDVLSAVGLEVVLQPTMLTAAVNQSEWSIRWCMDEPLSFRLDRNTFAALDRGPEKLRQRIRSENSLSKKSSGRSLTALRVAIAFLISVWVHAANLELACLDMATTTTSCDDVGAKLRLYHQGHSVSVVDADSTETSDHTIYRVTLRGHAETCVLEVIALAEAEPAPRVSSFDCVAATDRTLALHISSELSSDFQAALASVLAQPRRVAIKSTLTTQATAPASAPASTPAPLAVVAAVPVAEPVSAPDPSPTWRFGVSVFGALSGFGAMPFGSAALGLGVRTPWSFGGEVGVRGEFRPPVVVPRGPVGLTLIVPYLRAYYRFAFAEHVELDAGLQGEIVVGLSQLDRAFTRTFVSGALGPAARLRFPLLSGHFTPFVDAGLLASFHRVQLRSGSRPEVDLLPVRWSIGAGVELSF